jgi:glucokinase
VTIDWRSKAICNCGVPGCIEVLASGTAIAARHQRFTSAEAIGEAVHAHDPVATAILDETSEMLGAWLGSVVSLLDPDMIVIGGGVSRIGEPLFSRLRHWMPRKTINQFANDTPIVPAQLAEHVGIIGAAAVMFAQ